MSWPFVRSYRARAAAMSASVSVTGICGAGRWLCTSPTTRPGLRRGPHRRDAAAMREQGVMIGLVESLALDLQARGELAVAIAVADEAGDLVDREPARDAVAQPLDDRLGVAAEGVGRGPDEPAAAGPRVPGGGPSGRA